MFDWNLASYPPGTHWYFNPFAWQLMFVFAAWCGTGGAARIWPMIQSRAVLVIAVAWIAFAFLIVMTWHSAFLDSMVPKWMIKVIYPIDKTDLDMLRFTHFLALALVVSRYIPRNWGSSPRIGLRPLVLCGQHSLPNFLPRRVPVVRRALHAGAALPAAGVWRQIRAQHRRHGDHDGAGVDSGSGREGPEPVRRRRESGADRRMKPERRQPEPRAA